MKPVLAIAFTLVAIVAVVFAARDAGPVRATGIGPNIELGTPVGLTVPVLATTAAADPYSGFNIHVTTSASAGVLVDALDLNANGTILAPAGELFCYQGSPLPTNERVIGCVSLPVRSVTSEGLLATLAVTARGDGCVYIGLVSIPGDPAHDTYTVSYAVAPADPTMQQNSVNTSPLHLLIGRGTEDDCPLPTATPTSTLTPTITPTFTPEPTATPHSGTRLGPDIAMGAPDYGYGSLIVVPVDAVNAGSRPFSQARLHIQVHPGAGVSLEYVGGDDPNTLLFACFGDPPKPTGLVLFCLSVDEHGATGPGPLGQLLMEASGDGCVDVSLALDTYTIDAQTDEPQGNYVNTNAVHVLVGSGSEADCPDAAPSPTGTGTATPTPSLTPNPTDTPTDTPTSISTACTGECPAPTSTLTPGSIATDTPTPPLGATATATANPEDEIQVIAVSTSLCLAFSGPLPFSCFDLWRPGSQQRLAEFQSQNAPAARGCLGADPATSECRLIPSDFAALTNLTTPQLHADDPGTTCACGPFPGMYVLAFVPTDDPVELRTSAGRFVQVEDYGGPFPVNDSVYVCNGQFEDCDGDGQSLKHLVVVPLGGYGAAIGPGRITVSQGQKNASLDFTVVGEPDSVQIDAYSTTIRNGVVDLDPPGNPNYGLLSDPGECPLPTTEAALLVALAQPDRTVLIGRVRDAAGTPVSQAWLNWSGTGQSNFPRVIGGVGHLAQSITPSYDLGSFGIGSPQVLCGTSGTGTVPVTAEIVTYATGSPSSPGLPVDPAAHTGSDAVNIEVTSLGTATPTATPTLTSTPTSTPTACTGECPTPTPTSTPTATHTPTSTSAPANTPTSTPTDTATASSTPVPTTTITSTATNTPLPTDTPTPYPAPATWTYTPAATETSIPTSTAAATSTAVPTTTCPAVPSCVATATCEATPSCLTPTATDTPTSTPVPTTSRTPERSATASRTAAPTRTVVLTRTAVPTRTPTRVPARCADVTGDGRVNWRDVAAEAWALRHRSRNVRYDVNHDGRVNLRDMQLIFDQLGRRC